MNNFDLLAPVYDLLVRLVFRGTLNKATIYYLKQIPANSNVLVIGGGTGTFLTILNGCRTVYVEKSSKMIRLASEGPGLGEIELVQEDFLKWKSDQLFDVVVCPFILDVFSTRNLRRAALKITDHLRPEAKLLVTDFHNTGKWYHRLLLQAMHLFFRIFSSLESRHLKPIKEELKNQGFKVMDENCWMDGLVFTAMLSREEGIRS